MPGPRTAAQAGTDAGRLAARVPPAWRVRWVRSPYLPWIAGCAVYARGSLLGVAWAPTREDAAVRALGEAFERSALHRSAPPTTRATADELGPRAIGLADVLAFDEHQLRRDEFASFRWTASHPTTWVGATRAVAADPVLVPADLAYLRPTEADPVRVRPASSTGTALAETWTSAVASAAAELVERHELAIAVAGGFPARGIDPVGHGMDELTGRLSECGMTVRVGVVSRRHGLSTVVALVAGSSASRPSVAAGSAAAGCPVLAARSAVLEALGSLHLAAQSVRLLPHTLAPPRNSVERARWWAHPTATRLLTAVVDDRRDVVRDRCAAAGPSAGPLESLVAAGHDVAVLDITPAPVAPRYRVARIVAPSLALLHANELRPLSPAVSRRYPRRTPGPSLSPHPFV